MTNEKVNNQPVATWMDIENGINGENLEYVALYLDEGDEEEDWLDEEDGGSWHITGICSTREDCSTLNRHDEEQGYETRTASLSACWDLIDSLDGFRYAVMCRDTDHDPWMACAACVLREDAMAIVDAGRETHPDLEQVVVAIS